MTRGIVYVFWGDDKWLEEAIRSCKTAKEFRYPTCIVTDRDRPELQVFDHVKIVDFNDMGEGYHGNLKKWCCLVETPFDTSLLLDTDTYVLGRLDLAFELTEEQGFSIAIASGNILHYRWKEYVHYNSGVFGWCGRRQDLWDYFREVAREVFQNTGHIGEEAAISIALRRLKMPIAVLPPIYNCARLGWTHEREIKVYHSKGECKTKLVCDEFGDEFVK